MASFSSFRTAGNMQSSHLMSFSRPRKATPESAAEKRKRGNVSPVKVRREGVTRLRGQRRVNSSYEQYDSRRAAQLKKNAEVRKVAESKRGLTVTSMLNQTVPYRNQPHYRMESIDMSEFMNGSPTGLMAGKGAHNQKEEKLNKAEAAHADFMRRLQQEREAKAAKPNRPAQYRYPGQVEAPPEEKKVPTIIVPPSRRKQRMAAERERIENKFAAMIAASSKAKSAHGSWGQQKPPRWLWPTGAQ